MTHPDNLNFSPTADTRALWIDHCLLGVSAIALCLVVYLLATDFSFYSLQNTNLAKYKTVAIATETKLNVRKRSANVPVWDRVRDGDQLNSRDQIFTDKDSSTVLEFLDGSRIKLGENTLIKVQKGDSRTSFDVLQGDFVAEGGDGSIPVEINVQGVRTVLSGKNSAIKVKTDEQGKTSITVVGGKAEILANGKTVEVGPNQQGQFARDGTLTEIRKIPFVLLGPNDSEEFFLHQKSRASMKSVEFSWEPVKGVKLYRLEVAKDADFKKVVYKDSYDLPLAFVDLGLGSYHWRISSVNRTTRKREFSIERSLQVVEDTAPALMLPQAGETFRYREVLETKGKKTGSLVRFSWAPAVTERYEIEVARDAQFKQSISRLQLALPFHVMTGLDGGEYHWRVRNISWKRPDSPWSASRSFWVEEIPLPRVLASKADSPVVFTPSRKKPLVSVDWPKVNLAKEYVIEISRQANFSTTIRRETVRSPILDWKPKALGEYFWRIKPVDIYGRKTRYGPARKFTVKVTASELLYPKPKAFLSLPDLQGKLSLRWSETYLASRYRVEISKDPKFKNLIFDSRSRDPSSTWTDPQPGNYYWRVLTEAPGLQAPKESLTGQFEIMDLPLPTPPVLPDEYEFDVETKRWKRKKPKTLGWLDYLIRPAFAATKKKQKTVVIRWRSTGPTNTYLLELSKDRKFEEVFVRTKVKKPGFKWTGVKTGRFYLRVASVDKFDRQGEFSNVSRIVVRPKPPKLYYPLGHIERLSDDTSKIVFRWKKSKTADYYRVELSTDKDFKTLVFSEKSSKAELYTDPLESGTYYWRVKTILKNEMESRYSRARQFKLEVLPPPPKEYLVEFRWDQVNKAKRYAFELSRDIEFGRTLRKDNRSSTSREVRLLEGVYYWKVSAIDAKGKQGPWSQVQSIEVPSGESTFVAIAPDFVERQPAARGPKREEERKKEKRKKRVKKKPPRVPKELYLEAGYGLVLNNYSQSSNDPAANYSGLNYINYGGKLHFWWDPHDFGLRGSYFGQIRTLFESGQVGGNQSPIQLTRHDIQGAFRYRLRPFGNLFRNELSFELGYRYMNVFTFRTLTSTSLQRVTTTTHHLLAAVGLETSLVGGLGVGARLGYSYPISHSGIILSSPVNLFGEASVFYEVFKNFLIDITYVYQLNRYNYVDNDDTLVGGAVTGNIKDDNQFLKLSIGYRLRL